MKAFLKFDLNILTKKVLEEKLSGFGYKFSIATYGEVEFFEDIPTDKVKEIEDLLSCYGIQVLMNQKQILVQKIKDVITEMVNKDEPLSVKSSVYLTEKLDHSYGYLSNVFSEITFTSIENFIILQKIELAKSMIINGSLTLTEIAFKLNYSSVAHLSTQFKNITGITPSAFQRIIQKRRVQTFNN